jgi:hypothetical protein
MAGCEFHRCLEPLAYENLEVHLRDLKRGPIMFCHGLRGEEKQRSLRLQKSLSLSLFRHREVGEEAKSIHARECRGTQG